MDVRFSVCVGVGGRVGVGVGVKHSHETSLPVKLLQPKDAAKQNMTELEQDSCPSLLRTSQTNATHRCPVLAERQLGPRIDFRDLVEGSAHRSVLGVVLDNTG